MELILDAVILGLFIYHHREQKQEIEEWKTKYYNESFKGKL